LGLGVGEKYGVKNKGAKRETEEGKGRTDLEVQYQKQKNFKGQFSNPVTHYRQGGGCRPGHRGPCP